MVWLVLTFGVHFFQIRSKCVPFQSVYSNFTLDFLNFRKGDVNQFQRYCFKSFIGNTNKKWTIYWKFATWSVHVVSLVRGDDTSTCSTNRRDFLLVVVAICDRVSYFHKLSSFLWMSWIILIDSWEFGWSESGAKMQNLRNDCLF